MPKSQITSDIGRLGYSLCFMFSTVKDPYGHTMTPGFFSGLVMMFLMRKNVCRHDLMSEWCRYPRSNSTHEDQISEIDVLVRWSLEGIWIG